MIRVKTFDATGIAPSGILYSGDINAIQDAAAAQSNFAQTIDLATMRVGETGLQLLRYGTLEARLTGAFRTDGIIRGLGGLYAGAFTTTQRNAIPAGSRPYGLVITNQTTNRLEVNLGTDPTPNWQPAGAVNIFGAKAAIPSAATSGAGTTYFATDQIAQWISDGSSWLRMGQRAGDLITTLNSVADPGRILCQGQAWPGTTDIYADLWAKWGGQFPTVLPDLRGRVPVALGTHADVSAIGGHEGLAVASRRPRHKHVVNDPGHVHTVPVNNPAGPFQWSGAANTALSNTGSSVTGITVGPQTGAEPTDSAAYYVVNIEAKL